MKRPGRIMILLAFSMLLAWSGEVLGQADGKIMQQLVQGYDLLEAGNLDRPRPGSRRSSAWTRATPWP